MSARVAVLAAAAIGFAAATAPTSVSAAQVEPGILQEQVDNLPNDEALQRLGEALGDSVEATQSDPSIPGILEALDRNIASTRRIRELVESSDTVSEEQIAEIAKEVGEIAESFREIADLAPAVFQRRWESLSSIDAIGKEIGFRIADSNARLEALRQGNGEIDKYVRSETLSTAEIEKLRLTRQANDAEIHSLEAAVAAWHYFSDRHTEVIGRLGDQSENLDVFFHALRENARVYGAASQTLNMANSLKLALSDLGSVESLDTLRSNLVDSWGDLMKIVDEVNGGLMLQPGM